MKQRKHRLLSLLLAFALMLSLAPATFAADSNEPSANPPESTTTTVKATGISIDPKELTMQAGDEPFKLTATVEPSNTTETVNWSSDNPGVATVTQSGLVAGVREGKALITAAVGDFEAYCKVTIEKANRPAKKLTVTGKDVVRVDETIQLTATVEPENTTDSIKWSSNMDSVATVDQTGKVTGVSVGNATITVQAGGITKTHPIEVWAAVTNPLRLAVSPTGSGTGNLSYTVGTGTTGLTLTARVDNAETTNDYRYTYKLVGTDSSIVTCSSPSNGVFNFSRGTKTGTVQYEITVSSTTSPLPNPSTITVSLTNPGTTTTPSSSVLTTTHSQNFSISQGGYEQISVSTSQTNVAGVRWSVTSGSDVIKLDTTKDATNLRDEIKVQMLPNDITRTLIYVHARKNGTATLTATLLKTSTQSIGESLTFNVTVTDGTLSTSPSSINISSGINHRTSIYAYTNRTISGSYVRWSLPSGSCARISTTDSNNPDSSSWGYTAQTNLYSSSSYNNHDLYIYGVERGTTTLTATLYDSAGNRVTSVPVYVNIDSTSTSGYSLYPSPSNSSSVYLYDRNYWDDRYYYSREFSVTPMYNGNSILNSNNYHITYSWSVNGYTQTGSTSRYFTLSASNNDLNRYSSGRNTLTCTATISDYNGGTVLQRPSVTWTVYNDYSYSNDYTVSATVYDTSSGYDFDERDDKKGSSIISQMESKFSSSEYLDYVRFHDVTDTLGDLDASISRDYYDSGSRGSYDLRDVTFTPAREGRTGTATFSCTLYGSRGTTHSCTINIKVVEGTSSSSKGDIEYSARAGNEVNFNASDFRSWWRDNYSRGDLDYVRFTSVSSGNLYANYSSSSSRGTNVVSSSSSSATACYYNPTSRQTGIDDLTFVPSNSSSSSITIRFTAYGTTSSSSSSDTSLTGKVVINYTNASVSTINYSTTGTKSVYLSASDFTSRYRDAVGSSAPSNMTIRFRSVPTNGTLSIGNTNLSSSNISSYNFASSSGSNKISDVKYTPKSNSNSSDSVNYDCYTGNTLRFSGSISFSNRAETTNQPASNVTVSYSTAGGNVTFNASNFIVGKGTAMAGSNYLVFGTPSSGSLYVGSTQLASGSKVSYVASSGAQLLGNVSYHPAPGFNGTATIGFTAYNADNTVAATGTVNVLVSQTTANTTPSTTTAPTFGDVTSKAWYYNDVTVLAQAGIVNGRNDGLFHPNDPVNYGEALKLILLAAGYQKQVETGGATWAQNYLNLAISNSILSGAAGDYTLSKNIDRTGVATMAAKALKLTPVTSGSTPYADTSDQYVLALTNAGIVQGDSSSGTQMWNGTKNLTRAEVSRIVYNIYKYRNAAPGGSTPTVDNSQPSWLQ